MCEGRGEGRGGEMKGIIIIEEGATTMIIGGGNYDLISLCSHSLLTPSFPHLPLTTYLPSSSHYIHYLPSSSHYICTSPLSLTTHLPSYYKYLPSPLFLHMYMYLPSSLLHTSPLPLTTFPPLFYPLPLAHTYSLPLSPPTSSFYNFLASFLHQQTLLSPL